MNLRRRSRAIWNRWLPLLGAAGFVLGCISIAANVALVRYLARPVPATQSGITRWSQLEPDRPQAFAANLRAMGAPDEVIEALQQKENPTQPLATDVAIAPAGVVIAPTPAAGIEFTSSSVAVPPSRLVINESAAPVISYEGETISSADAAINRPVHEVRGMQASAARPGLGARAAGASSAAPAEMAVRAGRLRSSAGPNTDATPAENESAAEQIITAPNGTVAIPVAFGSDADLSDDQKSRQDALQKQFVEDIGGGAQVSAEPIDPARWQKAQAKNDELFRTLFGNEAYLARQAEANERGDGSDVQ
jgi:hypothetical protein